MTTETRAIAIAVHSSRRDPSILDSPLDEPWVEATRILNEAELKLNASMSEDEKAVYSWRLSNREKAAFRLCRYLALVHQTNASRVGMFYLSAHTLGSRLGVADMIAWRILQKLQFLGVLKIVKKGTLRRKGSAAIATKYRWLPEISSRMRYLCKIPPQNNQRERSYDEDESTSLGSLIVY